MQTFYKLFLKIFFNVFCGKPCGTFYKVSRGTLLKLFSRSTWNTL